MSDKIQLHIADTELQIPDSEKIIRIGDICGDSNDIFEILGFYRIEEYDRIYVRTKGSRYYDDNGISLDNMGRYTISSNLSFDKLNDLTLKIISGELSATDLLPTQENISTSTSLIAMNRDLIETTRNTLQMSYNEIGLLREYVRQEVEKRRSDLNGALSLLGGQIKRLNQIIFTLELYSGVREDVYQIQSGQPADDKDPIYLNQIMRYMDTEVGDPSNGGVSYKDVNMFYDWLTSTNSFLKHKNYEMLLPQAKCVRIMRIRKDMSEHYRYDTYRNSWFIDQEMKTLILIRNGENIYAIKSMMDFKTELFPNEDELTKIFGIEDESKRYDAIAPYKNGLILMQGLIDRTTVFGNVAGSVNLLNMSAQESDKVIFQYEIDDNSLLTDGTKTFLDFVNTTNIEVGDRLMLSGAYGSTSRRGGDTDRFLKEYNEYNTPSFPDAGIYTVQSIEFGYADRKTCIIKYVPEYSRNTRRVSFRVYQSDSYCNFDDLSHRDLSWITSMQYDRRDRNRYLSIVSLLNHAKKFKSEEIEKESHFANLIVQRTGISIDYAMDHIHYWKTKNKWKRALHVDDDKAYRMIIKKIKSMSEKTDFVEVGDKIQIDEHEFIVTEILSLLYATVHCKENSQTRRVLTNTK